MKYLDRDKRFGIRLNFLIEMKAKRKCYHLCHRFSLSLSSSQQNLCKHSPHCSQFSLRSNIGSVGSINFFLYLGPCHKNSPNPRSFTLVSTIFLRRLNENWPHLGHFVVHWDFFLLILLSSLVLQFFHWGTRKINFQLCKAPFTLPNFFHHSFL